MTHPVFAWPGVLVCALIVIGVICRITLMRPQTHKAIYALLYGLIGLWALGAGLDLIFLQQLRWYEACGMAGVLLYFAVSRSAWRHGAPPETLKVNGAAI